MTSGTNYRSGRADIDPDIAEWDYGDYEGKLSSDIHIERPDWNIFRDVCPQGETPAQVSERADRLIARLTTLSGNIALFSHGHFLPELAARWIGLPIDEGQPIPPNTTSLSILSYNPTHPEVRVVSLWNFAPKRFAGCN